MSVKAKAFAQSVIEFYPKLSDKTQELKKHYLRTRGNLRFKQLELFQERWGLEKLSEKDIQKWSERFTALYSASSAPLFPDVLETLKQLKTRGHFQFLSSSVPQADLDVTIERYPELKGLFEVTLGTSEDRQFRKGKPHLEFVSNKLGLPLSEFAFVGDAAKDVIGAKAAGVYAIGMVRDIPGAREELQAAEPDALVESLAELLTLPKLRS